MRVLFFSPIATVVSVGEEPPSLGVLRDFYLRKKAEVKRPVDGKYIDALENLKTQCTKSGNLNGALSVESEISRIRASISGGTHAVVGAWLFNKGGKKRRFIFSRDNFFVGQFAIDGSFFEGSWKAGKGDGKTVYLTPTGSSKRHSTVRVNNDGTISFRGPAGSMSGVRLLKP